MNDETISYAKTVYGEEEINAVVKCLRESTQMGKYSREFESKISNIFNKKYSLYVNSGSSALYLGIESLELESGSEVITPVLTFSTTIGCLVKNRLIPVFIDVKENTYCIDCDQIEKAITKKTVAILAPNLLGNICDWIKIKEIAKKYNLIVIEDSADTIGATLKGKSTGYYTDMSITSFYGSHIINCAGNGGSLSINDENTLKKAKLLRSWGRSSSLFDQNSEKIENRFNVKLEGIEYDAKFVFEEIGYNLEGSEIGAAFGLEQLKNLENNIKVRQKNFRTQCDFFNKYSEYFSCPIELKDANTAWLAFPLTIKDEVPIKRKDLQIYLEKRNIQTRVIFTGNILRQPMTKNIKKVVNKNGYQNADKVMKRGILLPLHHGLTEEMIERLHQTIENFINEKIKN